jgi:hypothetical protein
MAFPLTSKAAQTCPYGAVGPRLQITADFASQRRLQRARRKADSENGAVAWISAVGNNASDTVAHGFARDQSIAAVDPVHGDEL